MMLIVDDNEIWGRALGRILSEESTVVSDIDEAVKIAEDRQPRVIVLDVYLGRTLSVHKIGDLKQKAPGALIVVMTADPDHSTGLLAVSNGAYLYLDKVDAVLLPQLIFEILGPAESVKPHLRLVS